MMLQTILKYKSRQIYNSFAHVSTSKKMEWLIPLVLIPYFVTLIKAMNYIYKSAYESSGWQKLMSIAIGNMAVICFFVFISTFVLTLYRLSKSKDIPLYMSLPISNRSLFGVKIIEACEDTLRSALLPLPVIIAFSSVLFKINLSTYAIIFIIGWLFALFQIANLSLAFSLIIGKFVSKPKWSYLLRVIAVLSALAIILIFMRYYQDTDSNVSTIPFIDLKSGISAFNIFPIVWLIKFIPFDGVLQSIQIFYVLGFALFTVFLTISTYYLFKFRFQKLWMEASEISQNKKQQYIKSNNYQQKGSFIAFLQKEIVVIKRDPHLLIGLIVPLIMFPAFTLFKDNQPQTQVLYITLISFLGSVAYTLSCIGREAKVLALLRSLPVRMSLILRVKFSLSLILNLGVTIAFILIFSLTRRLSLELLFRNLLIGCASSAFFSSLGVALASIYPKLDYTNPMRAIKTAGLYLFYIIAMTFIATMMITTYGNWILMLLAIIFWGIIAVFLLRLGAKKLESMDT